ERRGTVGRPGTEVRLAGRHVAGIGFELNVDYLAVCLRDLTGEVRFTSSVPMPYVDGPSADGPGADSAGSDRPGAEGTTADGRFASNLGWADVPLGAELAARLGPDHPPLALENDAKLSALAEAPRLARRGITDLVYVTGDIGVGAGIIADGRLIRGWSGFSGE